MPSLHSLLSPIAWQCILVELVNSIGQKQESYWFRPEAKVTVYLSNKGQCSLHRKRREIISPLVQQMEWARGAL